jgi:hypothetical protein
MKNPAQNTVVIDPRLAVALGRKRPKPVHLRARQQEKVAHHYTGQFGSLDRAAAGFVMMALATNPKEPGSTGPSK